jgi:putative membrane protein
MMWGNGMGWGGWLLMTLTTVAFWALVVFGIVALFRGAGGVGPRSSGRQQDARQILDERFARGEIDAEEYRLRRSILSTHG